MLTIVMTRAAMRNRARLGRTIVLGLAAGLSLQPLVAAAVPAAETQTLRVTGIDRAGQPQQLDVYAINVETKRTYRQLPGESLRVPRGTYAIETMIGWAADSREYETTIAARTVKVQSDGAVTFDARNGQRVPVAITDDASTFEKKLLVQVVVAGVGSEPRFTSPDATYILPDPSKEIGLHAHAILSNSEARYDLVRDSAQGLPATFSMASSRPQLARVDMQVRTLDPGQGIRYDLSPRVSFKQAWSGFDTSTSFSGPAVFASYRTPGPSWGMGLRYTSGRNQVSFSRVEPSRPAGRSSQVWGDAVWGPHSSAIQPVVMGSRLSVLMDSKSDTPLCRAQKRSDTTKCAMAGTAGTVKLYRGNKLIASYPKPNSRFGVSTPIPSASSLYKLVVRVDRKPGAELARTMTGEWVFRASGTTKQTRPKLGMPRLNVAGLDLQNSAAVGSTSGIKIAVDGWTTCKALVVEASFDGGKTWTKTATAKTGSSWNASVRNAAQPGFVTLRVRGKDGTGQSFRMTYVNAYRLR